MAFIAFPDLNYRVILLTFIILLCCSSGQGAEISGQMPVNALICFNKFIYNECNEAYRLNPSGNINVPADATGIFCQGPCLRETQSVLNCIDTTFANFVFYNKATVQDIRDAIHVGCNYPNQRGNFGGGWSLEGETSKAQRSPNWISFYALLPIVFCFFIL